MNELPFVEDIYDLETYQLAETLAQLNLELKKGPNGARLPKGITSFDKFERKALKLKDCIELELEERAQVDNVISFFTESSKKFLDDDSFFKIDSNPSSAKEGSSKETAASRIKANG